MKFYFLSDRPCALKIGGLYVGLTGGAEKFMNVDPADKMLCEFIPASPLFSPVSFIADEDFIPTDVIREYFLPGAAVFYAHDFLFSDGSMRLVKQEKYSDCVATLFVQNKVFASVESADGIFTYPLDASFIRGNIYRREDCVIFFSGSFLAVVSVKGKLEIYTPVRTCEFSASVKATIPFFDCMRHIAEAEWILSDTAERIGYSVSPSRPSPPETALLALTEGLLYGFDLSPYATEGLVNRIDALKGFAGDYKEVLHLGENAVGLAYEREENSFTVVPYEGRLVGGKVDSLREIDVDKEEPR